MQWVPAGGFAPEDAPDDAEDHRLRVKGSHVKVRLPKERNASVRISLAGEGVLPAAVELAASGTKGTTHSWPDQWAWSVPCQDLDNWAFDVRVTDGRHELGHVSIPVPLMAESPPSLDFALEGGGGARVWLKCVMYEEATWLWGLEGLATDVGERIRLVYSRPEHADTEPVTTPVAAPPVGAFAGRFNDLLSGTLRVQVLGPAPSDELRGECWLPLLRAHSAGDVDERLWLRGTPVGSLTGTLRFHRQPERGQLNSGVLTEDGVSSGSSVFVGGAGGFFARLRGAADRAAAEVRELSQRFETLVSQMTDRGSSAGDRQQTIQAMLSTLRVSHKHSRLCWVYRDAASLHAARELILNIWKYALAETRYAAFAVRCELFELVYIAAKRAEVSDLPLLGFDQHGAPPTEEDLAFAEQLRDVMHETLVQVQLFMRQKGTFAELRVFCGRMLAVLSFRLPHFGAELDRAITPGVYGPSRTEADDVPEWRGTRYPLAVPEGERALAVEGDVAAAHLLDWRAFHAALPPTAAASAAARATTAWADRLAKHGLLYFVFVEQYMRNALDVVGCLKAAGYVDQIHWETVPGYVNLVKGFLLELRHRDVGTDFTDGLRRACFVMLADRHLASVMCAIVLRRTSVHRLDAVAGALDLVGSWMGAQQRWTERLLNAYNFKRTSPGQSPWDVTDDYESGGQGPAVVAELPETFDAGFLVRCFEVLLDCPQLQVTLKSLEFLYHYWDCLREPDADRVRALLRDHFPALFLNWNAMVQKFFYHVLAYRALRPNGWSVAAAGAARLSAYATARESDDDDDGQKQEEDQPRRRRRRRLSFSFPGLRRGSESGSESEGDDGDDAAGLPPRLSRSDTGPLDLPRPPPDSQIQAHLQQLVHEVFATAASYHAAHPEQLPVSKLVGGQVVVQPPPELPLEPAYAVDVPVDPALVEAIRANGVYAERAVGEWDCVKAEADAAVLQAHQGHKIALPNLSWEAVIVSDGEVHAASAVSALVGAEGGGSSEW